MRSFLAAALVLFFWGSAVLAQNAEGSEKPEDEIERLPETGSISSSLSKALNRFRAEQEFQKLRDERIRLLETIPQTRALVQSRSATLANLDIEIQDLRSRLKASESAVESDALRDFRNQLISAQSFEKEVIARAKSLETDSLTKEAELADLQNTEDELQKELRAFEERLALSRQDIRRAEADFRLLIAPIERERKRLRGEIEILEDELAITQRKDLKIDELSELRRTNLELDSETLSPAIISAEVKVKTAEDALENVKETIESRRLELAQTRERISNIERELRDIGERQQRTVSDAFRVRVDIEKLDAEVKRQIEIDKVRLDDPDNLRGELDALILERSTLEAAHQTASNTLENKILRQTTVENEINDLFIPRQAENSFKLLMSFAFALLVGLVIWKFFGITRDDEKVRRVVFSAEAGIQFVTLFSLVIAIILFGITGILEGKELSALLGGISGYILGRATPVIAESGQQAQPGPAAPPIPAPTPPPTVQSPPPPGSNQPSQ
ncbi:hypothetical protein KUV62_13960 [Salipiger bermudensis]|uniref:hypothetical protein n=1 Tax=Salipiger bermudensis TaxID=344736 RepID=UPI001C9A24A8|nr:hypothetical protein [Salipiger bermudensis]MBY6005022.1 hypothetical protein [Salipiger bermudensis]